MIVLCDEDIGTGVPKALTLVGYDARSIVGCGWQSRPDEWWLTQAGRLDWLVLSCDKRMMLVPSERDVIKSERVGIVYLTKGEEYPAKVLSMMLLKWRTLELLESTAHKPFVRFLSPRGQLTATFTHHGIQLGL